MPRWRPSDLTKAQHEILDSLDRITWDGKSIIDSIEAARVHNFRLHHLTDPELSVRIAQQKVENRKPYRKQ